MGVPYKEKGPQKVDEHSSTSLIGRKKGQLLLDWPFSFRRYAAFSVSPLLAAS